MYTTRKTPKPASTFPISRSERDRQHQTDTEHLPNLRSTTQKALRAIKKTLNLQNLARSPGFGLPQAKILRMLESKTLVLQGFYGIIYWILYNKMQ